MYRISKRIKKLKFSPIMQYNCDVAEFEKQGIKFYRLNIAQPDIQTDISYFNALKNLKNCTNGYSESRGLFKLRQCISDYCNDVSNCNLYKPDDIIITNGASDAIIKTLLTLCDVDDEIILFEPFFSDYLLYTSLIDVNVKSISYNNINRDDLVKLITKKTKCILFSNPNNPDGNVLSNDDIDIILDVAKEYNLFIISDEVYSEICYTKFNTLLNYGVNDNLVIIDSMSKKFCNCGARIGFIISKNKSLLDGVNSINDCRISLSNSEQLACIKMFDNKNIIFKNIKTTYGKKLFKVIKELDMIKNIKYIFPNGGLSILIDISCNATEFCKWLIFKFRHEGKTLLLTPAENFYLSKEGVTKIRMSITLPEKELLYAIKLLKIALTKYLGGDLND